MLPERLDATYVGEDGGRHRPVMLHRAVFGSFERFIGAPDRALRRRASRSGWRRGRWWWRRSSPRPTPTPRRRSRRCAPRGLRAEADLRNEKINYKVREHSLAKVPVILAVGQREVEERTVSLRRLGEKESRVLALDAAVAELAREATPPDLR